MCDSSIRGPPIADLYTTNISSKKGTYNQLAACQLLSDTASINNLFVDNLTVTGTCACAIETFAGVGTTGIVPVPIIGDETKFLSGSGTWIDASVIIRWTVGPYSYNEFTTIQDGVTAAVGVASSNTPVMLVVEAGEFAGFTVNNDYISFTGSGFRSTVITSAIDVGGIGHTMSNFRITAPVSCQPGTNLDLSECTVNTTITTGTGLAGRYTLTNIHWETGTLSIDGGDTVSLKSHTGSVSIFVNQVVNTLLSGDNIEFIPTLLINLANDWGTGTIFFSSSTIDLTDVTGNRTLSQLLFLGCHIGQTGMILGATISRFLYVGCRLYQTFAIAAPNSSTQVILDGCIVQTTLNFGGSGLAWVNGCTLNQVEVGNGSCQVTLTNCVQIQNPFFTSFVNLSAGSATLTISGCQLIQVSNNSQSANPLNISSSTITTLIATRGTSTFCFNCLIDNFADITGQGGFTTRFDISGCVFTGQGVFLTQNVTVRAMHCTFYMTPPSFCITQNVGVGSVLSSGDNARVNNAPFYSAGAPGVIFTS